MFIYHPISKKKYSVFSKMGKSILSKYMAITTSSNFYGGADPKMTPYESLEVSNSATQQQIRKKYLGLSKKYHPDKTHNNTTKKKMQEIAAAYELLHDQTKKSKYDTGQLQDHGGWKSLRQTKKKKKQSPPPSNKSRSPPSKKSRSPSSKKSRSPSKYKKRTMPSAYEQYQRRNEMLKQNDNLIQQLRKIVDNLRQTIIREYEKQQKPRKKMKLGKKNQPENQQKNQKKTLGHMFDFIHDKTQMKHKYLYPSGGLGYWNHHIKCLVNHLFTPKKTNVEIHFFQKPQLLVFMKKCQELDLALNYEKIQSKIETNFS